MFDVPEQFYVTLTERFHSVSNRNNSLSNLTCRLEFPLNLHRTDWEVGLCEIIHPSIIAANELVDHFYVYSNICKPRLVGDTQSPLLCVITTHIAKKDQLQSKIYDSPHYVPIFRHIVNNINIYIRTCTGNDVSFVRNGSIVITLHFRVLIKQ